MGGWRKVYEAYEVKKKEKKYADFSSPEKEVFCPPVYI
jgi:hypothetical protein